MYSVELTYWLFEDEQQHIIKKETNTEDELKVVHLLVEHDKETNTEDELNRVKEFLIEEMRLQLESLRYEGFVMVHLLVEHDDDYIDSDTFDVNCEISTNGNASLTIYI